MKVLVINAGSSSVKYSLIDSTAGDTLATGIVERIGASGTLLKAKASDGRRNEREVPEVVNAGDAMAVIASELAEGPTAVVGSLDEIDAAGHRIVQGADVFCSSTLIDESVKCAIKELFALAPLHNPANFAGIEAAEKVLPGKPQVAVFDNAFHSTMPSKAFMYGIAPEFLTKHKIRKYGFHGTSHHYVSHRAIEMLGSPASSRIVTAHIGNGISLAAVKDGRSVDTTMGLTPLEGVVMGTRSGSLDPAVVIHLIEKLGMTAPQVDRLLNKESGMLALAGIGSSDMRDIEQAVIDGHEQASLAFEIYCYHIFKAAGALAAAMGGMDALVFTAGVGEKSPMLRARTDEYLGFAGARVDAKKNETLKADADISAEGAACRVLIIGTQEDLMIARETAEVVSSAG